MSQPTDRPPRVLIAAEDPALRLRARTELEDAGFELVGEAASGDQAMKLAETLAPDVVVIEASLKRKQDELAVDFCCKLKGLPASPKLILVAREFAGSARYQTVFSGASGFVDLSRTDAGERLVRVVSAAAGRRCPR